MAYSKEFEKRELESYNLHDRARDELLHWQLDMEHEVGIEIDEYCGSKKDWLLTAISKFKELGKPVHYKLRTTYLYYIRINHNGKHYYKIGITTKSVRKRFNSLDLRKITILKVIEFPYWHLARFHEQSLLEKFNCYRNFNDELILSSGNSEIFIKDVLNC